MNVDCIEEDNIKKALKMLAIFLLVNTADYDYLHINY
jgi:hypothetical protein